MALDISQPFVAKEDRRIGCLEALMGQKACPVSSNMIPVKQLTHVNYEFAR